MRLEYGGGGARAEKGVKPCGSSYLRVEREHATLHQCAKLDPDALVIELGVEGVRNAKQCTNKLHDPNAAVGAVAAGLGGLAIYSQRALRLVVLDRRLGLLEDESREREVEPLRADLEGDQEAAEPART